MAPAALALSRADGRGDRAAGRGGDRARLRQAGRGGVRRRPRSRCSRCCAASPPALMALARRLPRAPHHHAAAGDRQHPPARRADAVGGDVARPRARGAGHRSPRSTAICAGSSWRRCRSARRRSISSTFPTTEADRFGAFLKQTAPRSTVEDVPMLRGRIVARPRRQGRRPQALADAEWVLQSDRGLTYTGEVPSGSKVVEGEWWGADYNGPPLVSIEKKIADGLGLEDRRRDRRQRARPRYPGHASPICAPSTGRASASISCWCSRPTPSRARRTPISRP